MTTDSSVFFVTSFSSRLRAACRGWAGLGLALLLALSACQGPTVTKPAPGAQAKPQGQTSATPAPEAVEPVTGETAVTRIDLDRSVKIGLLLPLSGRHARLGNAMLNAAQLALFDIADDRFSLVVRDTGGTPDGARAAAQAVLAEGVWLILGPLFSTSTEAMLAEAQAAQINTLTFSNDRSVAGNGVFVMGLAPYPQIHRLIAYARQQGLNRFAVLAPDTRYGQAVIQAVHDAIFRNNAELSRIVSYKPDSGDVSAEVRRLADYDLRRRALLEQRQILLSRGDEAAQLAIKRLDGLETLGKPDFDAVILPEGGKTLLAVAPLLAYYDIDPAEVRYLGTSLWEEAVHSREPALYGGWFTAPPPDLWTAFKERYRQVFGEDPPRLATLAYDAAALAAVLARRAFETGTQPDFSVPVLTQAAGFAGVDGVFRFLPNGEVERNLAILEVRRGGRLKVLDKAARTFRPTGAPTIN